MQRIALSTFLVLSLLVTAQAQVRSDSTRAPLPDATSSDTVHRKTDPRSLEAHAFLDTYGTPSPRQIAQRGWPVADLPLPDGLVRHKLGSKQPIDQQPYVLLVDSERRLMYLVKQEGGVAVPYGPVKYPRGI